MHDGQGAKELLHSEGAPQLASRYTHACLQCASLHRRRNAYVYACISYYGQVKVASCGAGTRTCTISRLRQAAKSAKCWVQSKLDGFLSARQIARLTRYTCFETKRVYGLTREAWAHTVAKTRQTYLNFSLAHPAPKRSTEKPPTGAGG